MVYKERSPLTGETLVSRDLHNLAKVLVAKLVSSLARRKVFCEIDWIGSHSLPGRKQKALSGFQVSSLQQSNSFP
jgi:hypothetical protein